MGDECREGTKEEVELFRAKHSLKSARTASTDKRNRCASDSGVARGPGQPLPLGACALPAGLRVPRVCPQQGPGDPQLLFISDIDDHACTAEFTSASE